MKRLLKFVAAVLVCASAHAEPTKTIFNPFTGKQDYITRIDSNTVQPGPNCTSTSNSNGTVTVNCSGGGGGVSSTTVLSGINDGVLISSGSQIRSYGPMPYDYLSHLNGILGRDINYSAGIQPAALVPSTIPYQLLGTNGGGNNWTSLPNMSNAREYQGCTALADSSLLCCGGNSANNDGNFYATCDLMRNGTTTAVASMGTAKDTILLATLPNNYVVQGFGATSGGETSDSQILVTTGTPAQWAWINIPNVNFQRGQAPWSVTPYGFPFIPGGVDNVGNALNTTEYLSSTYTWCLGPTMITKRYNHAVWNLDDGRLFICGGHTDTLTATNACEFCDLALNKCYAAPSMNSARELLGWAKLKNGNPYVAGGYNNSPVVQTTAEIFIVKENRWVAAPSMSAQRQSGLNFCGTDVNGNVECLGGETNSGSYNNSVDSYNPNLNTDTLVGNIPVAVHDHYVLALPNGQLTITGGSDASADYSTVAYFSPLFIENKTIQGTTSQVTVLSGTGTITIALPSTISISTVAYTANTFSTLGAAAANGSFLYCSDCTVAAPTTCTANLLSSCICAGSGSGAFAERLNGTWYCAGQ